LTPKLLTRRVLIDSPADTETVPAKLASKAFPPMPGGNQAFSLPPQFSRLAEKKRLGATADDKPDRLPSIG
jgi:hypothetical protein